MKLGVLAREKVANLFLISSQKPADPDSSHDRVRRARGSHVWGHDHEQRTQEPTVQVSIDIHVVRMQILREKKKKYLVHVNLRPNQCNFLFVGHPVKKKIRAGEGLNNNLKLLFLVDQIFRRYVDKFVRTVIFFSTCFLFMN